MSSKSACLRLRSFDGVAALCVWKLQQSDDAADFGCSFNTSLGSTIRSFLILTVAITIIAAPLDVVTDFMIKKIREYIGTWLFESEDDHKRKIMAFKKKKFSMNKKIAAAALKRRIVLGARLVKLQLTDRSPITDEVDVLLKYENSRHRWFYFDIGVQDISRLTGEEAEAAPSTSPDDSEIENLFITSDAADHTPVLKLDSAMEEHILNGDVVNEIDENSGSFSSKKGKDATNKAFEKRAASTSAIQFGSKVLLVISKAWAKFVSALETLRVWTSSHAEKFASHVIVEGNPTKRRSRLAARVTRARNDALMIKQKLRACHTPSHQELCLYQVILCIICQCFASSVRKPCPSRTC